ncbi:peptidase C39 family protein [Lacisediminihabitans profunda]|uniref:Uncharacterized protein n=1 Tax=Lacisediminihabitans profunda TaxID=2594790 RepID=A0A5C8UR25_9MICO|nr:peptidase C39 family protein [Lacisediminihabitans profunda]TXN30000.1 hypothetical protein FVP33_12795 [Lacisediminihabitans profunda]
MPAVVIETLEVRDALPADVVALLSADQRKAWELPRGYHRPRLWLARDAGGLRAAALTSGRPHTAYRKVVDIASDGSGKGVSEILGAIIRDAHDSSFAGVKVEIHPWSRWIATSAVLADLGFTPLADPLSSSAGTRGGVGGWVRWDTPWMHPQLAYYGQTTDFTCGAIAALAALERAGIATLSSAPDDERRAVELSLWRQATNFPACEPLGLVVATTERLRAGGRAVLPEVHLSTDEPILVDLVAPELAGLRAQLQRESLDRARQLGIPVHRDWMTVDDLRTQLAAGNGLLLLIDDAYMNDDPTPHWVFAHAFNGRHVLVQDPWIDSETGETWVDAHELPLSLEDVDTMTRYGTREYRGVIVVPGS